MSSEQDSVEYEVGSYAKGSDVVVYVNQGGVCIFRRVVRLRPELSGKGALSLDQLRVLSARFSVGRRDVGTNDEEI